MPDAPAIDPKQFRTVLGHFPTGVTIVTGMDGEQPAGFTIGSFTSVSLEPPMVGFVGRLARYMRQVANEAEATAFLGRDHYRRRERQRVGCATATNRNPCRVKLGCWNSRCRSCEAPRSRFGRP